MNSTLWWHGPQFLLLTEENWPSNTPVIFDKEIIELKQNQNTITVLTSTTESVIPEIGKVIDIKSYSSLQKLLRITAYVTKFVEKMKNILTLRPEWCFLVCRPERGGGGGHLLPEL